MPQVTVYIREDDLNKWKAIEKKSEWIHEKLKAPMYPKADVYIDGVFKGEANLDGHKLCKHGYDPKFCKHSKPGKLCK